LVKFWCEGKSEEEEKDKEKFGVRRKGGHGGRSQRRRSKKTVRKRGRTET